MSKKIWPWLAACAFLHLPVFAQTCLPISGKDRILGGDLALADPAFAAIPAAQTIGYLPAPGAKRVFAEAELARIARANNIQRATKGEVCFEIPIHSLDERDILSSMRRSLPPDAQLSLVESPGFTVPAGPLEFPLTGLEPASASGRIWRGYVRYGETLRMKIWARVTVERRIPAVVAASDLAINVPIGPGHVRIETANAPLDSAERVATRMEEVLGRVLRRSVAAGSPIPLSILDLPPSVHRGDAVEVEVQSGPARIQIRAVAESSAKAGDMVDLRNPSSGKTFRARLGENSKAVIVVGAGQAL